MNDKPLLLLVDDDPIAIQALSKTLSNEARQRFALSGTDALRLAREAVPDLILLDVDMPGMSGFEVCKKLKAEPALAGVPVIFLTSHKDALIEAAALDLGAADFVSKPLVASQVIARVRTQLRAKRVVDEVIRKASSRPPTPELEGNARILIVDDDTFAIQAVHRALASTGAQFLFATNGEEALRLVEEHRPDVVLLDVEMPGLDGFEVCRRLQAQPESRYVSVAFITRYSDATNETLALEVGATDFISKPYQSAVLQARVRNMLRLKQQADAALRAERVHWQRLGDARVAEIVAAASDAILTADAHGNVVLIKRRRVRDVSGQGA